MDRPEIVYAIYIITTPEKLWAALTGPEFTRQYFFGRRVESDWKVGSIVTYWMEDGRIDVAGPGAGMRPAAPALAHVACRVA